MIYTRRIALENFINARDLGGFPVPGGQTRYGVFIRSELPKKLSDADRKIFREQGLTMSLDFRATLEASIMASAFKQCDWVECRHMPTHPETSEGIAIHFWKEEIFDPDFDWGAAYIRLTEESRDWVRDCINIAAECEGALHFHCYTGKDRTGVFAALLLALAGVSNGDISADYGASHMLLDEHYAGRKDFDRKNRLGMSVCKYLYTHPVCMLEMLEYLQEKYGSVENYVKDCGVSDEAVEKIKAKFIEKF